MRMRSSDDPRYELGEGVRLARATGDEKSHFFGYYDKSPIDPWSGTRLLCHRTDFDGRDVAADDAAEVGYIDLRDGTFYEVGATRAFNWQQGAMLQWLPGREGPTVIYNDFDGERFCSRIVEIESGERRTIPHTIYAVHPSGRFALALNYDRLYYLRGGYRYPQHGDPAWNHACPAGEGIFRVDLETGDTELLVELDRQVAIDPLPAFSREKHWLDHAMWNPSGDRFALLHRWSTRGQCDPHHTRLYTVNADGGEMHRFPDTRTYSHMAWRGDREMTLWARRTRTRRGRSASCLRRVTPGPLRAAVDRLRDFTGWLSLPDRDGAEGTPLAPRELPVNGHNTWTADARFMLTDTYEDAHDRRHLLLYDSLSDCARMLASFQSAFPRTGYRCDLHPRFGSDELTVVVDSACTGRRQVYVLEIDA